MEESKKGILIVAGLWSIFLVYVNTIHVEKLPYYWLDYFGEKYKIAGNLLICIVIISSLLIVFLPKSKAEKRREIK